MAAETAFNTAISIEPNAPGALNGLGQIYLSRRKYADAEKFLLQAAPQAPAAWFGLARLYLLESKFELAEKWAQKTVNSGQDDGTAKKMLDAAKARKLSDGLRMMLEPPVAEQSGQVQPGVNADSSNPATPPVPSPKTSLAAMPNTNGILTYSWMNSVTNVNEFSAATETWSPTLAPGEKPDLQKTLGEAKELMNRHAYEGALQRYLWFFNHAMEYDQGMSGVRVSFVLSDWIELGRRYPKARQALVEIRDGDVRKFSDGGGYSELFSEVLNLNRELQDDDGTVVLFKAILQKDRQLAAQCYLYAQNLLIQRREYALCLECLGDPQAQFDSARRMLEMQIQSQQRVANMRIQHPPPPPQLPAGSFAPPDMGQFATNNFVGQVCKLIEILVATGNSTEAEKIQAQAVTVLDSEQLKNAVSDANAKIQRENNLATPENPEDLILAAQPPVVVETFPASGTQNVTSGELEIRVRFSKPMQTSSWSLATAWENSTPELVGQPRYSDDHRTCVLKVRLEPNKSYGWWLNTETLKNFTDDQGHPSVPYLLIFHTANN